jgi:hypothetical protein
MEQPYFCKNEEKAGMYYNNKALNPSTKHYFVQFALNKSEEYTGNCLNTEEKFRSSENIS